MHRYIITYKTLYGVGIVVVWARSEFLAINKALPNKIGTVLFDIKSVRKLYNPLHDPRTTTTTYEISLLKNGIHSANKYYDIPFAAYNRIAQIYGDIPMTEKQFYER